MTHGDSDITDEEDEFAYQFFCYMRLIVNDDFKIPPHGTYVGDRTLEKSVKQAIDEGHASKKIEGALTFVGSTSYTLIAAYSTALCGRLINYGPGGFFNPNQLYVFNINKDSAGQILKNRQDPDMERFVGAVVSNINLLREPEPLETRLK